MEKVQFTMQFLEAKVMLKKLSIILLKNGADGSLKADSVNMDNAPQDIKDLLKKYDSNFFSFIIYNSLFIVL